MLARFRLNPIAVVLVGCSGWIACGDPALLDQTPASLTIDPTKTVTIQVHGWNGTGATKTGTFGDDRGGGDIVDGVRRFTALPHGQTFPMAANQIVATEYYGTVPPPYYTAADRAEVAAKKGIPRYAAIVGKYARHVLSRSGADAVNLTCHSMGCLISRYLIEHDVEHLVSDGKLRRWVSFAGVVDGAKLADLDAGKWVDDWAKLLGVDLIDVEHMSRTWVESNVAIFDHKRTEGNNPNFGGLLVHHILATNPRLDKAWGVPLLDLLGHGAAPNDGIVLSEEMHLHAQQPAARFLAPSGASLPVSRSYHAANHFSITDQVSSHALASAALVGSRRVRVSLSSVTLVHDKEHVFFDVPPAEIAVESQVRYPYVTRVDPSNPLLSEVSMERRVAPMFRMNQGETKSPALLVYDGPVFDGQSTVAVQIKLSETDFYPAAGVNENLLSKNELLGTFDQEVPLSAGDYTVTTPDVRFTVRVEVERLY